MPEKRLLLLSNSRNPGQGFLEHGKATIADFLGGSVRTLLFVPFAGVLVDYDEYASLVRDALADQGLEILSVHEAEDPLKAVETADAIAVGGGNTFALLRHLTDQGLLPAIQARAESGTPYIGWSAGANVACPTIKTTNDMPIMALPTFDALELVPFQINPHFVEGQPEGRSGETREHRIAEFTKLNPKVYAVGLREGSMLVVEGARVRLLGDVPARIFVHGQESFDCPPSEPLDFLLHPPPLD